MRSLRTLAVLALVASPMAAETLDDVLAKHFEALGGRDKIAAVQSAKMVARQVFGPQEVPATILWKRPNKVRLEFTLQGPGGDTRSPPAFKTLDLNGDGRLTLEEFKSHEIPRGDHEEVFKVIDTSGDGVISEEEYTSHRPPPQPGK